jgi:cysteinyl-tRNA synthetase
VDKIIKFIEVLIDKGLAYRAEDGSVYFSLAKFPKYGELSGMNKAELKSGARVAQDEYSKENPADFVLWKAWNEADGEVYWESPFGKGRPGWSIECSVMSTDALGATIDIHTGGVDLIFPHHENEIAQSEGYSGVPFVRFWLHNEHLLVDGAKMSKSLNNFYTLDDIRARGFEPLDFRYLMLGAHYRSKLNFTWDGLEGAKRALAGIRELIVRDAKCEMRDDPPAGEARKWETGIEEAFADDLDTPKVLAILHQAKSADLWLKYDKVLGLGLSKVAMKLSAEQENMVKEREQARKSGDFVQADGIRKKLLEQGIVVEDTPEGTKIISFEK